MSNQGIIVEVVTAGPQGPTGAGGVSAATLPLTYDEQTKTVGINAATTSAAGSMSAADKAKLNGLATVATSGAYADLGGRPTLGTAAATDASAYATAAQGVDSREWIADTITQAEAETGTATARRAFTAQRVFQAVAAWWTASSAKAKLDGVAAGATVNSSDATLLNRANHTGTQAAGTITGLATVATSGTYADLSGRPTLGTASPLDVAVAGDATSAQVVKGNDSRLSDARTPTAHTQAASTISDSTAAGRSLLTAADATAQRTALGLGSLSTQSGTFSGTSSGTNTGDQTISLTGDVTGNGTGSFAATLANTSVSAGSYGTASQVAGFTVDAKGRLTAASNTSIAITPAQASALPATFNTSTITYAATVDLDMAALNGSYCTISLTGNLEFTAFNRAAGRSVVLRLICDSTQRTLTFPASWVFIGTKPANIAASKTAVLSIAFFGTANSDAVLAYAVQS